MTSNPYALSRPSMYANQGMVSTSQPLAAQAGLHILREGGNAVDAAVSTAIALTVLEPASNGIGGDAFALIWNNGKLHGLNGSGRAPALLELPSRAAETRDAKLPMYGWPSVTVPGAPKAWIDVHQRFGSLPLQQLFAPAIYYARHGYPISPTLAHYWHEDSKAYLACQGSEYAAWRTTFMPEGFVPIPGRIWRSEAHARTLEQIAASAGRAFYEGTLAEAMDRFSCQTGGYLRADDLARHRSEWCDPIHVNYRGYDVWELPPNTQGIATLQALNLLSKIDMPASRDSVDSLHLQIEAMKVAYADTIAHVADPGNMTLPIEMLLGSEYADKRRALIGESAGEHDAGEPPTGDTVYLCTADKSGMMVSFIQSNFESFGSGVVIPDTGIALQNRGYGFTLQDGHPNQAAPGKRPFHTIMPGFMSRDGKAVGPFGVMAGFMQPQGHLQVVLNTVDYGMDPQMALDTPRWRWLNGLETSVEHTMPRHLVRALQARGHQISIGLDDISFGRGQIIWRTADGGLVGGSDARTDGQTIGY